ncbi:MAG TPA: hypothetical protein VGH38_01075 [Bryobacteraceae bacterium]
MSRIFAIFRKDARHLWPHIAIFFLLLALSALLDPTYTDRGTSAYGLLSSLLPLASWALVISVIHEEKLPGDRQYWLTRPLGWKHLLAAKILFIAAFINLPLLLSHVAVLAAMGIPLPAHFATLLWRQVFFSAFYLLPVAALAAITRSFGQVILTALLVFLPVAFGQGFLLSRFRLATGGFDWMLTIAIAIVLACGVAAILLIQYSSRRTGLARIAAGVSVLASLAVTLAFFQQHAAPPAPKNGAARITLDTDRRQSNPPHANAKNTVVLDLPVRVDGIPTDAQLMNRQVALWLQGPGIHSRMIYAETGLHNVAMGRGWQILILDRGIFEAARNVPVNLSGSLDLTVFGNMQALPLPKQHDVVVPRLGVCSPATEHRGAVSVVCYSPFPRASLYLGTPGGGANWIVPQGFVAPPIPSDTGFEILTRFSSQLPISSGQEMANAQLIAAHPLGRLHLPFEFHGIRLADYGQP